MEQAFSAAFAWRRLVDVVVAPFDLYVVKTTLEEENGVLTVKLSLGGKFDNLYRRSTHPLARAVLVKCFNEKGEESLTHLPD